MNDVRGKKKRKAKAERPKKGGMEMKGLGKLKDRKQMEKF
jgi:hypothetical protein